MTEPRIPTTLRIAARCAWPHRTLLASSAVCALAARVTALALPWVGGMIAAAVFERGQVSTWEIIGFVSAALGLFAAQGVLSFAGQYLGARVGEATEGELRARLYEQLQTRRIDVIHRRRIGELLSYFGVEVHVVSSYVTATLLRAVPLALTVSAGLVLVWLVDPLVGLGACIAIPIFLFVSKLLGRRIRPRTRQANEEHARALGIVQENLAVLPAIRAFVRETWEARRYRRQNDRVVAAMLEHQWSYLGVGAIGFFLAGTLSLGLIGVGAWRVSVGALAGSELVVLLLYGFVLIRPLTELGDLYGLTRGALASASRLQELFDAPGEPAVDEGPPLSPGPGRVELRDVRFGYGEDAPVLDGIDLAIEPGETIAIVGPNGAGKTTLAHLLVRFYSPDRGVIEIDGIDVSTVSLESLRRAVALVPQMDLLVSGTIRENIAFGVPEATDDEVHEVARAARAHEFISALPNGYDTRVGERGVTLSGGQRQRISIARALLRDPRVLILDEATAMFDPEGEQALLRDCRESLRTKTVIVITHRPAMLELADRVIRLDGGQAVDVLPGSIRPQRATGGTP